MITSHLRSPDLPETLPPNLDFLLGLSPSAMTLGLGNIRTLLGRLDNPQRSFRTVVVAGTNGKGSVVAMTDALLRAQGLRVGRFISPHVYSVNERVVVNGDPVPIDELEAAAARVRPLHDSIGFSYFEAITAIAFLVYAAREVDVAVLEVGLGGRFDATNVTEPEATVITSIGLDHRRLLGDTPEEIILEKLGITRSGVPLFLGPLGDTLTAIARERGDRDGFPVIHSRDLGSAHVVRAELHGLRVALRTAVADYGEVSVPFPGEHQAYNALLAVAAAERVARPLDGVGEALASAYLPGRFEPLEADGVTFILDVAHNDAALCASAAHLAITRERGNTAMVMGLLRRKELFDAPARLVDVASRAYLVAPATRQPETALAPAELFARYFEAPTRTRKTDVVLWPGGGGSAMDWRRLVEHLIAMRSRADVVYVSGSHTVVEGFGRALFARESAS